MKIKQSIPLLVLSVSTLILQGCGGGSSSDDSSKPQDNVFPVITLIGSNPLNVALDKPFADPGAMAFDDQDGDISSKITESNNLVANKAGCFTQTYTVSDSAKNEAIATRTVLVGSDAERHSPNYPPQALDDSVSTPYTDKITIRILDNDSDQDCDPLSVTLNTEGLTGEAKLNADNTVSFDPENNIGSLFFTYTVTDGHGGSSTTGVTIASHDPNDGNDAWPDIQGENVTTNRLGFEIDLLANDTDADGDTLILDMVDNPQHGTVVKMGGGVISYTPNPGYTGSDIFYYGVHDGHGHNGSGVVNVTVTP